MSIGPKALVGRLNRKLASQGKVIGKTQGEASTHGQYYLIDSDSDTIHYISLSDLESMAIGFGVTSLSTATLTRSHQH